jgi:hypothetical protein
LSLLGRTDYSPSFSFSGVFPTQNACACCLLPTSPAHEDQQPEKCYQHQSCFIQHGWKEHLQKVAHTRCPLIGCKKSGADFGTDKRFLQHWRNKHPEKLMYWKRSSRCFGGIRYAWPSGMGNKFFSWWLCGCVLEMSLVVLRLNHCLFLFCLFFDFCGTLIYARSESLSEILFIMLRDRLGNKGYSVILC